MITANILYKHLKKWVCQPKDHRTGWFNCLTFDGTQVVATNTHKLIVVKDFPTSTPHFENSKGQLVGSDGVTLISSLDEVSNTLKQDIVTKTIPVAYKVIPKDEECQWSVEINSNWFVQMKNAFEYLHKMSKKDRFSKVCMLNFHDKQLFALGANEYYGAKFLLSDDLPDTPKWYSYFNSLHLMECMELVIDTQAPTMKLSISFKRDEPNINSERPYREEELWKSICKIETKELIMVSTSIKIFGIDDSDAIKLINFAKSESVRPDNEAFIQQ